MLLIDRTFLSRLRPTLQEEFLNYDEEELLNVASILHGARISAGRAREAVFKAKLSAYFKTTVATSKTWDFILHEQEYAIDLKSAGFDHNTPVKDWCQKYLRELPTGYTGIFVVVDRPSVPYTLHWPVKEINKYGLQVYSIQEFFK